MGRTLGLYFLRRYLVLCAAFFAGLYLLISLIDLAEFATRASDLPNFTVTAALTISVLRVPMVMQQVVPFIGLFAAMATLISLNRRYELVVARAAGISAWQILFPICGGALIFGLFALGVLNPIAAAGLTRAEQADAILRSGKTRTVEAFAEPWIRQKTAEGETIIGARSVLNQGLELSDAVFFSFDAGGNVAARRDAEHATLRNGYWELTNVRTLLAGQQLPFRATDRVLTNLRPDIVQQRLARPETIPFFALPGKIEIARSFGLTASRFATQFQTLVAMPFLLVAMAIIAATVSMKFVRSGQSVTMIVGGVLAGFLLYIVSVLSKAFGNAGLVPSYVVAWVPVITAMFFGVTFLLFREDG